MRVSYTTVGSCATQIEIDIEEGKIVAVEFANGCPGNTQAVAALVAGMEVRDAVRRLKGIPCQGETPAQTNWPWPWNKQPARLIDSNADQNAYCAGQLA